MSISSSNKSFAALAALLAAGTLTTASASAAEIATPTSQRLAISSAAGDPPAKKLRGTTYLGNPLRLLVLKDRMIDEVRWLKLRLPKRPNDSSGWVPESSVDLSTTLAAIVIDLSKRRINFFWDGEKLLSKSVIVGAPSTPTPTGQFAIYERYRVNNDLRPWVFELTAHSEALKSFNGGPGRVAIHGRHGALAVPWGTDASHGCVRTPDMALEAIAKRAPVGSPVRIKR